MEFLGNWFWGASFVSVNPRYMIVCIAITLTVFYVLTRKILRSLMIAIAFPGFIYFSSAGGYFLFDNYQLLFKISIFPYNMIALLMPFVISIEFPSFIFGFVITIRELANFKAGKSDYRLNKTYIFLVALQCALIAMTIYMANYNDGVE